LDSADKIKIEVSYARPDEQIIIPLEVAQGTKLEEAILRSGILERFPEIDLKTNKVGVFGRLGKLTQLLTPGDRVEVYRALIADPKVVRRERAAQGKKMKKGVGEKAD